MSDLRTLIVGGSGYNVAVADPRDEFPNHFVGDLVPTERGWVVVPPTCCPDGHGYADPAPLSGAARFLFRVAVSADLQEVAYPPTHVPARDRGNDGLMSFFTQVDDYELLYMSNTNQPVIGLINSGGWFAQLVFYPNGEVLPPDSEVAGQPSLYYHLDDFANCYALLRHEDPVYLLYNGPGSVNSLTTLEQAPGA